MQENKRPLIIGITGNIGSGKSTVSDYLRQHGYNVYSSDDIAHTAYQDPFVRHAIEERWGLDLHQDSEINRRRLADIVFNATSELNFLNSIIHPWTLKRLTELVQLCSDAYFILEVPLLFEANLMKCFDYIVLVLCDMDTSLERIKLRDNIGYNDAISRIKNQILSENIQQHADLVIDNTMTLIELHQQIDRFIHGLTHIPHREIESFLDHCP